MTSPEVPLEERIRTWLGTQGYPLEMRVAQAFQQVGAQVVQSDYYIDPITGDSREIDVTASWHDEVDRIVVQITLLLECKSSKAKPWLLFSSSDSGLAQPACVAQRAASRLGRIALYEMARWRIVQELPLFDVPAEPAYGVRQAFGDQSDVCFAAVSSVAAAAAAEAALPDSQTSLFGTYDRLEVIFPVIVTDARLFSVKLNSVGETEVNETSSGVLLWRNPVVGLPHTIIHIVSSSSLPSFVAMASNSAERLLAMCRAELRELLLEAREKRQHQRTQGH